MCHSCVHSSSAELPMLMCLLFSGSNLYAISHVFHLRTVAWGQGLNQHRPQCCINY